MFAIGGGLAGCFAAKAKMNAEVVLTEKNYVGKTGCSHYARDFMVFKEEWGDKFDEWMQQFSQIGEYIADRSWDEIILRESYPRWRDLVSWGEPFYKKEARLASRSLKKNHFALHFEEQSIAGQRLFRNSAQGTKCSLPGRR
jgi:succinate dehydrogenase/fumarate reductase flavoprotein subunit